MAVRSAKIGDSNWWVDTALPTDGGTPGGTTGAVPNLLVSLSGTGIVGSTISAQATGLGNPAAIPAYQWLANGAPISGANEAVFLITSLQDGQALNCQVTATNAYGTSTATAALPINAYVLAPVVGQVSIAPIHGILGDTFTSTISVTPISASLALKWFMDGVEIVGETGTSITPVIAGNLSLQVVASTTGGTSTVMSNFAFIKSALNAGAISKHNVTTFSDSFGSAPLMPGQKFLVLWEWQGGAFISGELGGAPIDGAPVMEVEAKTLLNVVEAGDLHFMAQLVTGLQITSILTANNMTFAATPNAPAYLKGQAIQLVNFDTSEIYFRYASAASAALASVVVDDIVVPLNGMAIITSNKAPDVNSPASAYSELIRSDVADDNYDFVTGFLNSQFEGSVSLSPETAVANRQVLVAVLGTEPDTPPAPPSLLGPVTMIYTPPLQVGKTITFGVPATSPNTNSLVYNMYSVAAGVRTMLSSVPYDFGTPAISYNVPTAVANKQLQLGCVPIGTPFSGEEQFSIVTETVAEAVTPPPAGFMDPAKVLFSQTSVANGGTVTNPDGSQYARADTVFKAGITVPAGKEIGLIRGTLLDPDEAFLNTLKTLSGVEYDGSADVLWRSNSGAADNITQYMHPYWMDKVTGAYSPALQNPDYKSFTVDLPDAPPVSVGGMPPYGPPNETLTVASNAEIIAALDRRIASGNTSPWRIKLAPGTYGFCNIVNKKLPGMVYLQSPTVHGAKFSGFWLNNCKNITLQIAEVNRTLGVNNTAGVQFMACTYCGIEWSKVYVGGIYLKGGGVAGWGMNCNYGIETNNNSTNGNCYNLSIVGNTISGPCSKGIYLNGTFDSTIAKNIFENAGGDCIHFGWGGNLAIDENWGARAYYPEYSTNGAGGWDHNDFIQVNSMYVPAVGLKYRFNCIMFGPQGLQFNPRQGIFSSKVFDAVDWIYEDNFVCSNSAHGITSTSVGNNLQARRNSVIRCVDLVSDQDIVYITLQATNAVIDNNVVCQRAGGWGGTNGLVIPMVGTDYSAVNTYYNGMKLNSTFYGCRPKAGQITLSKGAYGLFADVIDSKLHIPNYADAYRAWKQWYDPLNEITAPI